MTIEKNRQGDCLELKLIGWLDTVTSPVLDEELNALDETVTSLVFDCGELEYISSAGLREIVAAYKKMNGDLTLKNVSEDIMNVIRMTGLDKRMKFA
ncbi:MAG: STAS domain-containing protein [Lachnospiraceae bacterium]|nr:STAS domain-containing protein [Lachnospiraceae bacterium]MBR4209405.1 STAS domain-containing protein [Lachnospiraceae bacterium]